MAASRVTSSFWLAMCCFGGADAALTSPNSLLQLGSSSTRKGATARSGATSLSSTLAGFQKFTDQLLAQRLAGSTIDDDTRTLVTFIVDIIDDEFYDELQALHKGDIRDLLKCAPCGSKVDFNAAAVDYRGQPLFNSTDYTNAEFCSHEEGTASSNGGSGQPNDHAAGTAYSTWTWTSYDDNRRDKTAILGLRDSLKSCISGKKTAQKVVDKKCSEYESYRVAGYTDHANSNINALKYPDCANASTVSSLIAVDGKLFKPAEKVHGEVSDRMIQAEDEDTVAKMEACLLNMHDWINPLYDNYTACKQADGNLGNCIDEHTDYEQSVCQWRTNQHALCRKYQSQIENACPARSCPNVEMKVSARKADYEAGQRIICLLEGIIQSGTNATTERSNTSSSEAAFGTLLANCRSQETWNDNAVFSTAGAQTHKGTVTYFDYTAAKATEGNVCVLSRNYAHSATAALDTKYYNASCKIDLTYWEMPINCSTVAPAPYNSSYCEVDDTYPAMPCSADFFTNAEFGYNNSAEFGPGEVYTDDNGDFWDSATKSWTNIGDAPDIASRTFPDYNSGFFDYFTYGNCVQCAAPAGATVDWNAKNCGGSAPSGTFSSDGEGIRSSTSAGFECNDHDKAHPEGPTGQTTLANFELENGWKSHPLSGVTTCDRVFVATACD